MSAKFTKGPWGVHGDWMIVDSSGRLIAQFEPLNDDLSNANTPESFANAHLIAAAPEMYKALDDLANGRGLDFPIEQLLKKARGE